MRILPLLAVLPLAACSVSSDAAPPVAGTTRSFAIRDFSAVSLRGSDNVEVRVGSAFSVRATGPSAELDLLEITRVGDTLRIGRKNRSSGWGGGSHQNVTVFVTMPRIAAAEVAGSGNMAVDRVEGQSFDGSAAGSGNLAIATLRVPRAKLSIAGSGDIAATGSVARLTVDLAGSGNVRASGLTARAASISLAGSGNVRADVTGPADVSMVGSGDVDLGRGAQCKVSKMGSGDVHCGR
jgi:hypothetical protein